jgi:hypothetical protein
MPRTGSAAPGVAETERVFSAPEALKNHMESLQDMWTSRECALGQSAIRLTSKQTLPRGAMAVIVLAVRAA